MIFDEEIDRVDTYSSRWGGKTDRIVLTTGDADFRMPPAVANALQQRLDHGVMGYDTIPETLTRLILDRLAERYAWKVESEALIYLPGVVQGLNFACRTFAGVGGGIITEVPVYYPFMDAISHAGHQQMTLAPLALPSRWELDIEGLSKLASQPDVNLLMLCNPHNPLGRVLKRDELEQLATICVDNNLIVCSDEIHCDVLFDDACHIPLASLNPEIASQTITLMSPSKAFAISGLGGSFAIITDPVLRARFQAQIAGLVPNLNVFALSALEAAYGASDDWHQSLMKYLSRNRALIYERLQGLDGLKTTLPEAAYFFWLDFSRTRLSGTGPGGAHQALLAAGLELSDGAVFGQAGYLRLNFASPVSVIERACDIITGQLSG